MSSDKTYSKTAVADAEFCSAVKSEFMELVKWKSSRGRDKMTQVESLKKAKIQLLLKNISVGRQVRGWRSSLLKVP